MVGNERKQAAPESRALTCLPGDFLRTAPVRPSASDTAFLCHDQDLSGESFILTNSDQRLP